MRSSARFLILTSGLALAAVFLTVLHSIFSIRFSSGSVYPDLSTLKSEPQGTRALYEALDALPGVSTARQLGSLDRPEMPDADTLVLPGFPRHWWDNEHGREAGLLLDQVEAGAHAVIAIGDGRIFPGMVMFDWIAFDGDETTNTTGKTTAIKTTGKSLADRVGLTCSTYSAGDTNLAWFVGHNGDLTWPDGIALEPQSNLWERIGVSGEHCIAARRSFGKGRLTVIGGDQFLTNRALGENRRSDVLVDVLGDGRKFLFVESHLGVHESTGIVALARRHGLTGLFAGIALLVTLTAWRNAGRVLPWEGEVEESAVRVVTEGRAGGFPGLLARHIPDAALPAECIRLWQSTHPQPSPAMAESLRAGVASAAALRTEKKPDALGLLRRLHQSLQPPRVPGART